ncbi:kinase-like domain-containing protein [Xylaria arbuscula]|nr:kinase-like domain-containing protein [Xylaria arbuscula]
MSHPEKIELAVEHTPHRGIICDMFARVAKTRLQTCRLPQALRTLATKPTPTLADFGFIKTTESFFFCDGGYHPIVIGHRLGDRYRVVHKLGFGFYSTTWLARDIQHSKYVAVKVGTADSGGKEVEVLTRLTDPAAGNRDPGKSMILPVLNHFTVSGVNGTHPCLVTVPTRCSLFHAREASRSSLFPLDVARSLAAQLVTAVAYIHDQGYVHGDVHLGNILLRSPSKFNHSSDEELYKEFGPPSPEIIWYSEPNPSYPSHVYPSMWLGKASDELTLSEAKLILSDFAVAFCPSKESRFESYTPLKVRPPEDRFESQKPLFFASDIWSLGCTIWEMLGKGQLFDAWLFTEDDATADQIDLVGPLPSEWWEKWDARSENFMVNGQLKGERVSSWHHRFESHIQQPRRLKSMETLDGKESDALFDMIRSMLLFRPEDRASARDVLDSSWMRNWGIPAFEKGMKEGDS